MNYSGPCQDTALHRAIRNDELSCVCELLSAGADPDEENFDGAVPLTTCANGSGSLEIVRSLLAAGANPNGLVGWSSPLVSAAVKDHRIMVKVLVDAGADVNQPDDEEDTALMWATINEDMELVLYLLSKNADPRLMNRHNCDARSFAVEKGNHQIVAAIDDELNR
jgi:ankyrin repeat protein